MKTIILLHGAIGASDQLILLENVLNNKGYITYRIDFSGHGSASFKNQFNIEQFADELKSFIESKKIIQPHIFGYSMGGYVALYLASLEQNLIGNIITLGTKILWTPEVSAKEIKMLDTKVILEKVPKFAEALQKRHGDKWELLLSKTSEMMVNLGKQNCLTTEQFSKIGNKVLIGLADSDNMVSQEETNYAAQSIKNSSRFILENTKHPIETVDYLVLSDVIEGFLS